MCSGLEVTFKPHTCEVRQESSGKILFTESRNKNVYILYLDELPVESCFIPLEKDKWIWHKRAGHISMETISIKEAIIDESWIEAMKEEVNQFEKNQVWTLVPNP